MEIRPLNETPLEMIVQCLTRAFSDYFVRMPSDPAYWDQRWKGARVDYRASYGAFEKEELVGFMIHGLDFRNGLYTAFNTGTGVVPAFRGRRLVGKMYETAIPQLKERGIQACSLEVIQENEKAVKAYQSVGFSIVRELRCYRGAITSKNEHTVQLKKMDLQFFKWDAYQGSPFYSWDHTKTGILLQKSAYELFEVAQNQEGIGYFIINPQTGYLAQFDINNRQMPMHWSLLFEGIAQVATELKVINIDTRETAKNQILEYVGLNNYINQFEMELILDTI